MTHTNTKIDTTNLPNLRQIARSLELNYNMLLKKSKQPVAGEIYNPNVQNWDNVFEYIADKVGMEAFESIDWESLKANTIASIAPTIESYNISDEVMIRGEKDVYVILMKTDTHLVIMAKESTQPRVMNNHTFLHQSPRKIEMEAEEA